MLCIFYCRKLLQQIMKKATRKIKKMINLQLYVFLLLLRKIKELLFTLTFTFTLVKEDKRIIFYIVLGYCHLSRSLNSPGTR